MERPLATGLFTSTLLTATLSATALAANLGSFPPTAAPYGFIAAPAVTGERITDGSQKLYRVWFDNISGEGDLLQHSISSNGAVISPAAWSAADILNARSFDSRKVFTGTAPTSNLCSSGLPLDSFLCGDASNELANGGSYRDRSSKLGSLIHSDPVYVGAPAERYSFNDYLAFASGAKNRAGRVYVGANDGMLHAFDTSGNEIFGFIPTAIASGATLSNWASDATASPAYFVDGPQTVADAYHASFAGSSQWKTILVGGLGAGGKSYYGFDVTNPMSDANSLAEIAATRLWELDASILPGLGYTYGRPLITRSNAADNWVLIAPNGYAAGGEPILYIRDLNNPSTVIKDFDNLLAPSSAPQGNGLSSPTAIDLDGDQRVDYVYAGDLDGNLWRFDLSASNPANWNATRLFSATDASNHPQPILAAPEVAKLTGSSVMVYFGSGDFAGIAAATSHSFYALKDDLSSSLVADRGALQPRVLSATSDSRFRTLDESASPNDVAVDWSTQRGWYSDLASGEQLLSAPLLQDRQIQFMAHNPATGDNWLIHLSYKEGRLPTETVFDTNDDGALSVAGDNIDYVNESNPGDRVIAVQEPGDLISGVRLAASDYGAIAYLNSWTAGVAGGTTTSTVTTTAPLAAASCSAIGFDRFDFTSEPSSYSIKFIAHLSNDPADDIWIMRSGMNADRETISSTQTPAAGSAERGAGSGTTVNGVESWNGLTMYLGDPGSERVSMLIEYDGPYQIQSFTIEFGNIQLERIHDGVKGCSCAGRFQLCGSSARISYGNSSAGVSTVTLNNGYSFSSSNPIISGSDAAACDNNGCTTTSSQVYNQPAVDATGTVDDQLQSGDNSASGRIRWRELTF